MTHIGNELALSQAGSLGCFLGANDLLLCNLPLGNVLHEGRDSHNIPTGCGQWGAIPFAQDEPAILGDFLIPPSFPAGPSGQVATDLLHSDLGALGHNQTVVLADCFGRAVPKYLFRSWVPADNTPISVPFDHSQRGLL